MPRHRIISFYGFTVDNCIMDAPAVWEVNYMNGIQFSSLYYHFYVSVNGLKRKRMMLRRKSFSFFICLPLWQVLKLKREMFIIREQNMLKSIFSKLQLLSSNERAQKILSCPKVLSTLKIFIFSKNA